MVAGYDNTGVRKGQAINLAVHDAIARGESENPGWIYKKYVYYYTLAEVIQGSDIDMIQEVIENKNFDDVIKKLKETLK